MLCLLVDVDVDDDDNFFDFDDDFFSFDRGDFDLPDVASMSACNAS